MDRTCTAPFDGSDHSECLTLPFAFTHAFRHTSTFIHWRRLMLTFPFFVEIKLCKLLGKKKKIPKTYPPRPSFHLTPPVLHSCQAFFFSVILFPHCSAHLPGLSLLGHSSCDVAPPFLYLLPNIMIAPIVPVWKNRKHKWSKYGMFWSYN